jgi:predicted transcriptional regulator of viral defense system
MPGPYKESARKLYEIAQTQQGFFTTKQAIRAGFTEPTHPYHVHAGNWIREHRGIYRLADFPTPDRPDLMLWYLWSQNRREVPQGIYSHSTALSLHELSDLMPSKLHMTVPKEFRRSVIPNVLTLHRAQLKPTEVQEMHGVRVTRPLRTIADLLESGGTDRSQLKQALEEALRRGLVARRDIEPMPHDDKLQRSLHELAGERA